MSEPKLRKVETRNAEWAVATYAVLVDNEVIGHVDKYAQSIQMFQGNRGGRGQRSRTDICWGYRVPGVRESDDGCDTRRDAVAEVVRLHEKKLDKAKIEGSK